MMPIELAKLKRRRRCRMEIEEEHDEIIDDGEKVMTRTINVL